MTDSASQPTRTVKEWFAYGKTALEQGFYPDAIVAFQRALSQGYPDSHLGGEIQIWLATAYEAAGQNQAARDLCRQLKVHPDVRIRKQSADILYIWEAPLLKTPPDWIVQIPDLSQVEDDPIPSAGAGLSRKTVQPKVPIEEEIPAETPEYRSPHQFTIVACLIFIATLVFLAVKTSP